MAERVSAPHFDRSHKLPHNAHRRVVPQFNMVIPGNHKPASSRGNGPSLTPPEAVRAATDA
jgi:hypothetical protein